MDIRFQEILKKKPLLLKVKSTKDGIFFPPQCGNIHCSLLDMNDFFCVYMCQISLHLLYSTERQREEESGREGEGEEGVEGGRKGE